MAKKGKPKPTTQETVEDVLCDLAELAGNLNIPDDTFEGYMRDAANAEANLIFSKIKDAVMLDKLEFLYHHGFQIGRLRELIEEAAKRK